MTSLTSKWAWCIAATAGAFWGLGVCDATVTLFQIRAFSVGESSFAPFPLIPIFYACSFPVGALLGICFLCGLHKLQVRKRGLVAEISVLASVFSGVPILLLGLYSTPFNPYVPPADSTMLAQFDKHEATFNTLVRMAQADKGRMDSLSDARGAQYRRRLAQGEISHGLTDDDIRTDSQDDGIRLTHWRIPYKAPFFLDDGDEIYTTYAKGFLYLTRPPQNVVASLDPLTHESRTYPFKMAYRHIRGNWYLFYDYDTMP